MLCFMLSLDSHFRFDGKRVCNNFFSKAFETINEVQVTLKFVVKKLMQPQSTSHGDGGPVDSALSFKRFSGGLR